MADEHNISRGCGRGYSKGKVRSSAFSPRPVDRNCLSADWVECAFVPETERCIEGTIKRQGNLLKKIRPQKLAILKVGEVKKISIEDIFLDVLYAPTGRGRNKNKCHCSITGMTGGPADQSFQQKLANLANKSRVVDLPA